MQTPSVQHTSRSIDVARGMAALGVIWGHSVYDLKIPLELNGAFWVWIFLIISGFLAGISFQNKYPINVKGYFRFLRNRSVRIIPLAYLALTIGLFLEKKDTSFFSPPVYLQYLFLAKNNDMFLCGPLWTVATEVQFYLVATVLILLLRKTCALRSRIVFLFVLAFVMWWGKQHVLHAGGPISQPRTLIGNLHFFLIGIYLAYSKGIEAKNANLFQCLGVFSAIVLAWYLQNFEKYFFWGWGAGCSPAFPLGGGAVCAIIVSVLVLKVVPLQKKSETSLPIDHPLRWFLRIAEKCGFYCYGIYIWHSILSQINEAFIGLKPGFIFLLYLLLAVVIAPASYTFFEQPFLKLKK